VCVAVSFLCVLQCASFEVCDERCKGLGERCNPWALSFLCVLQCLSCVCCSVFLVCVAVSFLCVLQCASFEVCDERCKGFSGRLVCLA